MARKMRKFSAGGAQGKYDRRMADIKKDFEKDSAGKSGKALEVLAAKRAQRTADAKDDLAKRTGADRTATRAAERLAESNLTKTRKYGAPQSVTKDTAGPTGKVTDTLGALTAPKSGIKPQSFGAAFKEARSRLGAGKTFTFNGKSYTTNIAGEGRKPTSGRTGTGTGASTSSTNKGSGASTSSTNTGAAAVAKQKDTTPVKQKDTVSAAKPKESAASLTTKEAAERARMATLKGNPGRQARFADILGFGKANALDHRAKVAAQQERIAKEQAGRAKEQAAKNQQRAATARKEEFINRKVEGETGLQRVARINRETAAMAKGGAVKKKETTMKYRSGGSTPPKPTAADRAADAKFRKSIKNLKPTPEQAAAIGRANRSSGYAKGGKVKKMAVGGVLGGGAPMSGAAPTPAPMQSTPMPAGKAQTPPATGNNTGMDPAKAIAQMQASQPLVSRPRDPAPAPTIRPPVTAAPPIKESPAPYKPVTPLQNVQNFIDRKYSSATPNKDASAKTNTTTGVSTPAKFDRNQSLRDFNSVARTFLNQGVSNKDLIKAQGELRKLQMDNSSTPAQHQAAMQSIIARMNSLVPKKSSPQVDKRFAKGGSTKAATKSGRALVKKSADTEGRAMKKFAAGGLTSGHKAANGVAKKGLTKGKQVKMNKGGACYAKGGSVRSIDGIATKGKTRCKGARK